MSNLSEQTIIERYNHTIATHADQLTRIQQHLMDARLLELNHLYGEISKNLQLSNSTLDSRKSVLYDRVWLEEFSLGDITRCLGPEFRIYAGRKSPRIPNGDLLLMSRIVEIKGVRGNFENLSKIIAEYDAPQDAWFFFQQEGGSIPLSILMEIALQPCGVLSAWLQTQLKYPSIDYSFRNLDGSIQIMEQMDFRGKTITCQAVLENTVFSGSTIIQHFTFELRCSGRIFLEGRTTFGYFPVEIMLNQVGLDAGKKTLPWGDFPQNSGMLSDGSIVQPKRKDKRLRLIDTIRVVRQTEEKPFGYMYAERKNAPSDWYYANHFLDDPVMPGSLGIEMIVETVQSALSTISNESFEYGGLLEQSLKWKYRGQVLPNNKKITVDVTIVEKVIRPESVTFISNANLWADNLRIYEISGLSLTLPKKGM